MLEKNGMPNAAIDEPIPYHCSPTFLIKLSPSTNDHTAITSMPKRLSNN